MLRINLVVGNPVFTAVQLLPLSVERYTLLSVLAYKVLGLPQRPIIRVFTLVAGKPPASLVQVTDAQAAVRSFAVPEGHGGPIRHQFVPPSVERRIPLPNSEVPPGKVGMSSKKPQPVPA